MAGAAFGMADFSDERREVALSYLRREKVMSRKGLSHNAKLLLTVSLLVCDDHGRVAEPDLMRAMKDPSIVQAARHLMSRVA